jgi:urea transport system substrate-binding protein
VSRRALIAGLLAVGLGVLVFGILWKGPPTIRVGILHAQDGVLAASERPVLKATLFAIDELNRSGGLLGRQIDAVVPEVVSTAASFEAGARALVDDGVNTVFGCWSSAARRAVIPVIEEADGLLLYPLSYEGLEESDNVLYLGATANQRIVPATKWARLTFGRKVFLIGSDYVYPRAAHELIRDELIRTRGRVIGEAWIGLHKYEDDIDAAVAQLVAMQTAGVDLPDVILNTVNGTANRALVRQLQMRGITIPMLSFALSEGDLRAMDPWTTGAHYVAWSYFEGMAIPENQDFLGDWRRANPGQSVSEPMVSAYSAVQIWAESVRLSKKLNPGAVREAAGGLALPSPAGMDYIDPVNGHAWRNFRIAKVIDGGRTEEVWLEPSPIAAQPWPKSRSKEEWTRFLDELYAGWGDAWAAPIKD